MNGPRWPLTSPRNRTYMHVTGALSPADCDRAVTEGQALGLQAVFQRAAPHARRSQVGFFLPDAHSWLYEVVGALVRDMNQRYFGFELYGLETIQYTEYSGENSGCYTAHRDVYPDSVVRKLSMSIQLSDPADYDGCDLELFIHTPDEAIRANRDRGHALIFPSWTIHRVTPTLRGVRRTLVTWAVGPEFR